MRTLKMNIMYDAETEDDNNEEDVEIFQLHKNHLKMSVIKNMSL
jgi:hypothetical protein